MPKPVIEIDGSRFKTLDDFWEEISACLIPGARWGRNFDAFNDILRGGFGTPEGGFRLKWLNFQISRRNLSYPETIGWLENKAQSCHQSNILSVKRDIEAARRGEGQTIAEIIIDIIRNHGPGGTEEEDGVELELVEHSL